MTCIVIPKATILLIDSIIMVFISRLIVLSPALLGFLLLIMDTFFENLSISVSDEHRWNIHTTALAIIRHDQQLWILGSFIVGHDDHDATKSLDILGFHNEVTVASVNENDLFVALLNALLQVFSIEVFVGKRLACVRVFNWVVHSPFDSCAIIEMSKVAE